MAAVHDGWDNRLHRAVAIKLLYSEFNAQPDIRRRFEHEARAAAALSHPNIVAIHDYGEHDGMPFIVMERLPGRTLADEAARGPLHSARVRAVLDDVLSALTVAHGRGVLHRDLKPANILASTAGDAMKVADFGIAKTMGAAPTATGHIVGTMAYLSPERVAGAPASVADDLYAVGVLAYEALTGRQAFPQDSPAALVHAIMDAPPRPLAVSRPDIEPTLAAVIDRAMARDPRHRFADAEHMRAARCHSRWGPPAADQGARGTAGAVADLRRACCAAASPLATDPARAGGRRCADRDHRHRTRGSARFPAAGASTDRHQHHRPSHSHAHSHDDLGADHACHVRWMSSRRHRNRRSTVTATTRSTATTASSRSSHVGRPILGSSSKSTAFRSRE